MRSPAHTLYWQIAGLYLVLLLGFSVIAIFLAIHQFDGFLGEVEQRLNRGLAVHLVKELAPSFAGKPGAPMEAVAKRITGINPGIDLYLLDSTGTIKVSLTGKAPARDHVEVARLQQFLAKDALLPIRAEDPSSKTEDKVFSTARLPPDGGGGFLYVVLPGMPFETTAHMVRSSYIARGATVVFGAVLLTTLIAGLAFFFFLTRRFQRLTHTVRRFQQGALHERADTQPNDQIGLLAATFNEMAATIETQFDALKQTDEARRVFASNISHDFRTPLTALRGYTDRMLRAEDRLSPPERRQHLKAVMQSAAQLEHLADQLGTMVHLDGGNETPFALEPFSIAELVQDSIVKFTPLADQQGVALSVMNPQTVPQVIGDIGMIERVLANLMENAICNTPRDGKVCITLPLRDRFVIVRIEDNGYGIEADELPLIKQRFYRTQASRLQGRRGTGLGLAIADEIVAKHGSVLTIESTTGVGTTASFYLRIS